MADAARRKRPADARPPTPPAGASASNSHWASGAGFAVAALAIAAYANTLGHGFVWDDPISLNRWLPALQSLAAIFFPPPNVPQFPPDYYRPLQLLSYQIDRAVGGGAAWPFHLSVVVLHAVTTVLVFRTGLRLLGNSELGVRAAWWSAALFAVHPIHTESVAWMAARPDVMVACAGTAALLAYWRRDWPARRRSMVAAGLVLVALLCKENAVALLILIPASPVILGLDFDAASVGSSRSERRRAAAGAPAGVKLSELLPFAVAAAVYLTLRFVGLSRMPATDWKLPVEPVATFIATAGTYLRLLVVPYPQNAYISDLATGPIALGFDVILIGAAVVLTWWAWRRQDRPLLFALVWLGLTLAPSLAIVAKLSTAPMSERYLYLPSVGLCWTVGVAALRLPAKSPRAARLLPVALAGLVLAGLLGTVLRNRVWRDNLSLWSDTAAKNTVDAMPTRSLAAATLDRGDATAAEELFLTALERRNNTVGRFTIYNNLGSIALNRGDLDKAEAHYRKAMELTPAADCVYNLGLISYRRATSPEFAGGESRRQELLREARDRFEQAVEASPHDAEMQVALGQAYQALGERDRARNHLEQALRLGLPPATVKAVQDLLAKL